MTSSPCPLETCGQVNDVGIKPGFSVRRLQMPLVLNRLPTLLVIPCQNSTNPISATTASRQSHVRTGHPPFFRSHMGKSSATKELSLLTSRARSCAAKLDMHSREYWRFFSAFVRCPRVVGAVAPSSRRLATVMIPPVDLTTADVVVELGAGTGVVTRALCNHIGTHTQLVALELRDPSALRLQRKFSDVQVVSGSAEHLRQHLDRLGHSHADCIVSGLPWGSMPGDLQRRILDSVEMSLKPGGAFSAMAYIHASRFASARRFRQELERRFGKVSVSPVVWANLPPAFVYYCQ